MRLLLLFGCLLTLRAESVFTVLPAMADSVSASAPDLRIPWCQDQAVYQVKLVARVKAPVPLLRVTRGDWQHTLTRIAYDEVEVREGSYEAKTVSFLLSRVFPTAESGIKLKELWPFQVGQKHELRLRVGAGKPELVSLSRSPN